MAIKKQFKMSHGKTRKNEDVNSKKSYGCGEAQEIADRHYKNIYKNIPDSEADKVKVCVFPRLSVAKENKDLRIVIHK